MELKPTHQRIQLQVIVMLSLLMGACGLIKTASTDITCPSNQAILQVYESSLVRTCGCTEGYGTVNNGGSLTCTIKVGKTVALYFTDIGSSHSMSVLGNLYTGNAGSGTSVQYVPANATGTFTFNDNVSNIGGNIIVIP